MNVNEIKGYIEGQDITKIPMDFLTYPSKNVIVYKGVAFSRPGIVNDGTEPTGQDNIVGEFVWKDALGGEKDLRVTKTGTVQLKYLGKWLSIFTDTGDYDHYRFATWTDPSDDIVKNRAFWVNGTDKIFEWNGAIGVITAVNTSAQTVTIAGTSTPAQIGFDPGDDTAQPVRIVRFSSPGVVAGIDDYDTDSDMTTSTIHVTTAMTNAPAVGDIIIGAVVEHDDVLAGINKDDIYNYKNRVTVANFDSIRVHFSSVDTKLDFTVPAVDDRVATSPFFINLPSNYTAMINRYNSISRETTLWVSHIDGWVKVTALVEQDSFGLWVKTDSVTTSERMGALPFMVADYKGDIIFMAQDRTLQRVSTLDVTGVDKLSLISDDIEGLLNRMNVTEARLYYLKRYILILFPASSTLVMLDMVTKRFLPPQIMPISLFSVIGGVQYGHSSVQDETFEMFTGRQDLGVNIETVFAFPYYQGKAGHEFRPKQHTMMGVSARMTKSAKAAVKQFYNNDGDTAIEPFLIDGSTVKMFEVVEDFSWGAQVWGGASWGGDQDSDEFGRVYAFDKYNAVSWFEWRPTITVTGDSQAFYLLGIHIDDDDSNRRIPENLFIPK